MKKLRGILFFAWVFGVYVAWWTYVLAVSVVVTSWHRLKRIFERDCLEIGQRRVLTAPITGFSAQKVIAPAGAELVIKGPGEYDGFDVNIDICGLNLDIGAAWLVANSRWVP